VSAAGRLRGFTLAELLVSMAILALFLVIAYSALEPVIQYLGAAQAKADTQGDAVALLFKLEHDLHESDARSVFYDNGGAQPLPLPSASPADVTVFAVATANTGTSGGTCYPPGQFQLTGNGNPSWQGFEVFIRNGTNLNCVFENEPMGAGVCPTDLPCQSAANAAITAAKLVASPSLYGIGLIDIKLGADTGSGIIQYVNVKLQALSTVDGRTNVTSYTDELQTRN
jgi:prepilin-type N-terminal cleavage/methylation domain-containing protein